MSDRKWLADRLPEDGSVQLVDLTSASLLERLQTAGPGAADWQRLHDLYQPLIRVWLARRRSAPPSACWTR